MSPVTFNEPLYASRAEVTRHKGITGWIISHGFAKDERVANIEMLSIAGIGFLVIVGIWMSVGVSHKPSAEETARIVASTPQPAPKH